MIGTEWPAGLPVVVPLLVRHHEHARTAAACPAWCWALARNGGTDAHRSEAKMLYNFGCEDRSLRDALTRLIMSQPDAAERDKTGARPAADASDGGDRCDRRHRPALCRDERGGRSAAARGR